MIPVPSGVRVWLAVGRTDIRRGMNGLALQSRKHSSRRKYRQFSFVARFHAGPAAIACPLRVRRRGTLHAFPSKNRHELRASLAIYQSSELYAP
jgi:transposase